MRPNGRDDLSGPTGRQRLKTGLAAGVRKGWAGFLWMIKILVPISFLTSILAWSGIIHRIGFLVEPVTGFLSLPPTAALPLLIGMLTNIYGGIAAMSVLPLSTGEMTLIAVFLLTAHSLIQESVIQGKSGLHPLKAAAFRITAAIVTVLAIAPFFDTTAATSSTLPIDPGGGQAFGVMIVEWGVLTAGLCLKIFVIIMSLLIVLEVLKALGWIYPIVRALSPLLGALGLSRKVGLLWVTAAVFGLSYGAAVIVEEAKAGHLGREELEDLQLSIGINHSLVEDPALFLSLGLPAFWLWVPRIIMAMVATRLLSLWRAVRRSG